MNLEVGRLGLGKALQGANKPALAVKTPGPSPSGTVPDDRLDLSKSAQLVRNLQPGFRPELAFENPETLANALGSEGPVVGLERTADVLVLAVMPEPEPVVEEESPSPETPETPEVQAKETPEPSEKKAAAAQAQESREPPGILNKEPTPASRLKSNQLYNQQSTANTGPASSPKQAEESINLLG